ncbi:MAG TPA: hypothetical protein VHH32_09890, partial [Gemmatimonadales bacterium]|nr:hypothetical protein [Gemmatimonadales bacterium]
MPVGALAVLAQRALDPGVHSALNPAGRQAQIVDQLWDAMYLVSVVVFVLVVAALLWAALRRRPPTEVADSPSRERSLRTS